MWNQYKDEIKAKANLEVWADCGVSHDEEEFEEPVEEQKEQENFTEEEEEEKEDDFWDEEQDLVFTAKSAADELFYALCKMEVPDEFINYLAEIMDWLDVRDAWLNSGGDQDEV